MKEAEVRDPPNFERVCKQTRAGRDCCLHTRKRGQNYYYYYYYYKYTVESYGMNVELAYRLLVRCCILDDRVYGVLIRRM